MTGLRGKRILVVEDEYFLAADLHRALERQGAVALGPVGELGEGLALAEDGAIDAALLDVNLEGARSYAIADRLAERAVPFLFVTGYDPWALPPAYRDAPRVAKPFTAEQVLGRLERLVTEAAP